MSLALQMSAKSLSILFSAACNRPMSPSAFGRSRKKRLRASRLVSSGLRYCAQKRMSAFDFSAICIRCTVSTRLRVSSPKPRTPYMTSRSSHSIDSCCFSASPRLLFSLSKSSTLSMSLCMERSDGQKSFSRIRLTTDAIIVPYFARAGKGKYYRMHPYRGTCGILSIACEISPSSGNASNTPPKSARRAHRRIPYADVQCWPCST